MVIDAESAGESGKGPAACRKACGEEGEHEESWKIESKKAKVKRQSKKAKVKSKWAEADEVCFSPFTFYFLLLPFYFALYSSDSISSKGILGASMRDIRSA